MRSTAIAALLLMFAGGVSHAQTPPPQTTDMAVVVSESNPVRLLTIADLRKIFAGERRSWPGGLPVKLVVRSSDSCERKALLKLLGMSESEYKRYWTLQIFRGEAQAEPIALPSTGMVKEALDVFPGAIALVQASNVKPGMKVVKVEGRLPGPPEFRLR